MALAVPETMTLEEFAKLPVGPPNAEFEEGEVIPVSSPTPEHQDVVDEVNAAIKRFVREKKLGRMFREVDVFLPDGRRVYIPDLCYLSAERMDLLSPLDRKIHGAPDLVVEVTSGDTARDRVRMFQAYFDNGVPWYWIVDQQTLAIEEYRAAPEGYLRVGGVVAGETFRPRLFEGLSLDLAALLGAEAEAPEEPAG